MPAFHLNSSELRQRLAETIAWCSRQPSAQLTTEDVRQYLNALGKANQLMFEAYRQSRRPWTRLLRRGYQNSKKYLRGVRLLQDADPRSRLSFIEQLRSAILKPSPSLSEAKTADDRALAVRSVVDRRADLLGDGESARKPMAAPGLQGGRLLLYWPEENLCDGAAEYATRGFFDVDNTPPWDTWISFSNGTLLSWVPPPLIELVQGGIDVNPENCIQWMAEGA
jgi:hypothetical protein